jgi:superfamily II DNA or RNA helicase
VPLTGLRYRLALPSGGGLEVRLQRADGSPLGPAEWQQALFAGLGSPRDSGPELFAAADVGGLDSLDLYALAALRVLAEEHPEDLLRLPPAHAGAALAALLATSRAFTAESASPLRLAAGAAQVEAEILSVDTMACRAAIRVLLPQPDPDGEGGSTAPPPATRISVIPGTPAWALQGHQLFPLAPFAAALAAAAESGQLSLPLEAVAELLFGGPQRHPGVHMRSRSRHRRGAPLTPRKLLSGRASRDAVVLRLRFDYGGEVRPPRLSRSLTDTPDAPDAGWQARPGWVVQCRDDQEYAWRPRDVAVESAAAQLLAAWGARLDSDGHAHLRGEDAVVAVNQLLPALDPAEWCWHPDPSLERWRLLPAPAELDLELIPTPPPPPEVAAPSGPATAAAPEAASTAAAPRADDSLLLRVRGRVGDHPLPLEELRLARAAGGSSAPLGVTGRVPLEQPGLAPLLDALIDAVAQPVDPPSRSTTAASPSATPRPAVTTYRIPRCRLFLLPLRSPPPNLRLTIAPELRDLVANLGNEAPALAPPPQLRATLRPYQERGLAWLHLLARHQLGGILADDMGLGKTVQLLALLCLLQGERSATDQPRPSLVVAPASVLYSWKEQCAALAPSLRLQLLSGADAPATIVAAAHGRVDLLVCSYATLRRQIDALAPLHWGLLIIDEAQFLKNAATQAAQAARRLRAASRWALTGTPIENHLGELHAIADLVLPGLLGSPRQFKRRFADPIAAGNLHAADRLRRHLRPYLLRRVKSEVAPDLPPRTAIDLPLPLPPAHAAAYRQIADDVRMTLRGTVAERGLRRSGAHILSALTRLRQAACHPILAAPEQPYAALDSAKLLALEERLPELVAEGHSALLFSSFTSFLDLVELLLRRLRIPYLRLDGRTPPRERERRIAAFQRADGPPIFLISLRAGGTGLNLARADYVFQLDPWWNPAAEAQAADRAHRIGRKREVILYRLFAADTIETRVRELQQRKRDLVARLLGSDGSAFARSLTLEELEEAIFGD